jgi:hypothetical protein
MPQELEKFHVIYQYNSWNCNQWNVLSYLEKQNFFCHKILADLKISNELRFFAFTTKLIYIINDKNFFFRIIVDTVSMIHIILSQYIFTTHRISSENFEFFLGNKLKYPFGVFSANSSSEFESIITIFNCGYRNLTTY